jgi:hypothetical protein
MEVIMFTTEELTDLREHAKLPVVHQLLDHIAILEAQNKQLREALEEVEWLKERNGATWCPWCENSDFEGHVPDCPRQLALGIKKE